MSDKVLDGELLEPDQAAELALRPALAAELAVARSPGAERAQAYRADARSKNTRRTYAAQWRSFCLWCEAKGISSLPAEGNEVAIYLAALADHGRKASTIALALTAISQAHLLQGHPSPRTHRDVIETWKGIRRTLGTAQRGKDPLYGERLLAAVRTLPNDLRGARDRALLLLGFTGAFRRSELVALRVEDLRAVPEGLEVTLTRSKTDQEGQGRKVPIPREASPDVCPVRAVRAWLDRSGITAGPIFRAIDRRDRVSPRALSGSGHYVAILIKRSCAAAGVDPRSVSGHSLRAGLVTAALKAGASTKAVMRVTGHTSGDMVNRYYREKDLFEDPAAGGLLSDAPPRRKS